MKWAGAVLLIIGVAILIGYGAYFYVKDFLLSPDVNLLIRIALTALILGVIVLLVSVANDRYRAYKKESFKEIER